MATNIASLFAKVSADTSDFESGMRGVESKLNSVASGITKFATIGVAAAGAAIVGFGAGIVKATQAAMSMEQQLANIQAAMALSSEETAKLKALIEELGLDPNLSVSATEAAQAIEMLGKNGLTVDQILQGAARSTVLLANATGADFALAADVATSAMLSFGIQADQMGAVVNSISGSLVQSKFGINDYALALSQGGGVAAAVGVSFEDFNTTIAAISPLFGSGSDAGTSFKTMLQRMVPQSKDAAAQMQTLGIITADGANRFFDATGKMQGMDVIAGILQDSLAGLSDEQKNNALSTIFGTDAMRAAVALAMVGDEKFAALKTTIGKTDAEQQAATRMNTLAGKIEVLRGVIEAIAIKIGEKFLPAAKKIVEWAQNLITENEPQIDKFFGTLADRVTNAIEMFVKNWPQIAKTLQEGWKTFSKVLPDLQVLLDKLAGWFTSSDGKRPMEWFARFLASGSVFFTAIGDLINGTIEGFKLLGEAVKAAGRLDFGEVSNLAGRANRAFSQAGMTNDEMDRAVEDILRRVYGKADGGWAGGLTMVGERGPELVNLPQGSYVNTASESKAMMRGGTTITIQNLNLSGTGAQANDLRSTVTFLNSMYSYGY